MMRCESLIRYHVRPAQFGAHTRGSVPLRAKRPRSTPRVTVATAIACSPQDRRLQSSMMQTDYLVICMVARTSSLHAGGRISACRLQSDPWVCPI